MQNGKLIVIEGIDGAGKTTQVNFLIEKLKQSGKEVETFKYPRHEQEFFGKVVDQYLNGGFGDPVKLDPHLGSILYACDRWESKDILKNWLSQGKYVVLDRYATSNMAHQCSKIDNLKKRNEFLDWLDKLEFEVFKILRPDIVFFLDVSASTAAKLMETREDKNYINGKQDGHESNFEHLQKTHEVYHYLCKKYNWKKIDCVVDNQILDKQKISDIILNNIR